MFLCTNKTIKGFLRLDYMTNMYLLTETLLIELNY